MSVIAPPGNLREKYSVILACGSNGEKLPPAVIAASTGSNPRTSIKNGILVFSNPGTSMANSTIMSHWIQLMVPNDSLLVLDSFRGHLTQSIKDTCKEQRVTRAVIPGGLTSKLQPLDLTVNRSFKSHLRDYFKKDVLPRIKPTNLTLREFGLDNITKAVRYAWNKVSRETIRKGFAGMMER